MIRSSRSELLSLRDGGRYLEHTVIVFMAGDTYSSGLQVSVKLTKFMWNPDLNKSSYTTMENAVYFFCNSAVKRITTKISWFITPMICFLKTKKCRTKI